MSARSAGACAGAGPAPARADGERPAASIERLTHGRARAAAVATAALILAAGAAWAATAATADLTRYFTPEDLARAHAFRAARYPLFLARMATHLAALAALVALAPALVRAAGRIARGVPARFAEAATVAVVVAVVRIAPWIVELPASLSVRRIDRAAGFVHQGWGGWAADQALAFALDLAVTIPIAFALLVLVRRVRRYWIPVAAAGAALLVAGVYVWPVTVEPLFNRFTPLEAGEVRARAEDLLERAGLEPGPMFVMDASRRASWSNAYVTGLGKTQRVVLYDTLLERFTPAEIGAVLAHEIGHRARRHLLLGSALAIPAIVAGMAVAAFLLRRLGHPGGPRTGPEFLAAFAFVLALLSTLAAPVSSAVSRRIEADADRYALSLVNDPEDVLRAEIALARTNRSDPSPPGWAVLLFYSHPPLAERVAMAEKSVRAR